MILMLLKTAWEAIYKRRLRLVSKLKFPNEEKDQFTAFNKKNCMINSK